MAATDLGPRFAATMRRLLAGARPDRIGVALSGGGDSLALLALASDWAGGGVDLHAFIVDHALRPGSADEAARAAEEAARLGATPHLLRWQGWDGSGNLQAEARQARYALIAEAAEVARVKAVLLGHTEDDQAETVLLRLARGSGVEGLSAMSEGRFGDGLFLRPLLSETRAELRDFLTARGLIWAEDPSNDDPRFDRIRIRQALEQLQGAGITRARLAETARSMARARHALTARARDVAQEIVTDSHGILSFDTAALARIEEETRLRLVAHGLRCLSSAPYRPRLSSLKGLLAKALRGEGATLHGCQIIAAPERFLMVREMAQVQGLETPADGVAAWDGRWRIAALNAPGATIRALGAEGLAQIERPKTLPHAALLSHPGIWQGAQLIAAPGLYQGDEIHCRYLPQAQFHPSLISH